MSARLTDGTGNFDISDTDEYIEGIAAGLDRRLLARLCRGRRLYDSGLSISHGMTRDEARIRVEGFFTKSCLQLTLRVHRPRPRAQPPKIRSWCSKRAYGSGFTLRSH